MGKNLLDFIKKNRHKNTEITNIYDATKIIIGKLDEKGVGYEVRHCENTENKHSEYDWMKLNLRTEKIPSLSVELFIVESGEVGIASFYLCKVKEEELLSILKLINNLNKEYRYVKFALDIENNIYAEADSNLVCSDIEFDSRIINFIVDFL